MYAKILRAALVMGSILAAGQVQAASSLANPNGGSKKKICNTYYTQSGLRCTFCTYTNYPQGANTVCIKVRTPKRKNGFGNSLSN